MVGLAGFEPTTSSTPRKRATKLRYSPNTGLTDRDRTGDLKNHNLALYQLSYGQHMKFWCARQGSNLRPLAPEASALSAELRARHWCAEQDSNLRPPDP
jgi:hypothetical protein